MSIPQVKENRNCLLSLIIPFRGTPDTLLSLVDNITLTSDTSNKNYEIIVKIDSDDTESINAIQNIIQDKSNIYFIVSSRRNGYSSVINFIEDMTHLAHGKYILSLADDVKFLTNNWNTILEKHLTEFKLYFPKTVWLDNSNSFEYCWVIYPKEIINVLNGVAPHTLIDSWFYEIGNRMNHPAWGENILTQINEFELGITSNPDRNHGSEVYQTHIYHTNSAEFFHSVNLIKEHLEYLRWEKIYKHNIVNNYINTNEKPSF